MKSRVHIIKFPKKIIISTENPDNADNIREYLKYLNMRVPIATVSAEHYNLQVGDVLFSDKTFYDEFSDANKEFIIFSGLSDSAVSKLLDSGKIKNFPYKCVATHANSKMTFEELYQNLKAEHESLHPNFAERKKKMNTTAFTPANVLLPKKGTDMEKWAVIACDQFTSQPEYWNETKKIVGDAPSTLNLILPEIYLTEKDVDKRIENIHSAMNKTISDGTLTEYKDAFVYVRRIQSNGILREGIVGKIDLEKYDYNKGSNSEVRATEATVPSRIPPRVKVRTGAPLELPHIMILIDDPKNTVIEPLGAKKDSFEKLYDFKLMQGGGSISGYLVDDESKKSVNEALCALGDKDAFEKKYDVKDKDVLIYAMGDGNHSLATAKAYYEQLKAENPGKDLSNHPARYALVEIVNLHSDALKFEAIHRLITDTDNEKLIDALKSELKLTTEKTDGQHFTLFVNNEKTEYYIKNPSSKLTVGTVQNFLDKYLKENDGNIDYIHGTDTVCDLAAKKNGVAIVLPDMDKADLFPTVIFDGALPRKTFSMGHAEDKRYYVEARKIN